MTAESTRHRRRERKARRRARRRGRREAGLLSPARGADRRRLGGRRALLGAAFAEWGRITALFEGAEKRLAARRKKRGQAERAGGRLRGAPRWCGHCGRRCGGRCDLRYGRTNRRGRFVPVDSVSDDLTRRGEHLPAWKQRSRT